MSESDEIGMTVTPEMGFQVLERAKEAIYAAFEGQGDSPASAVSTAIVGYRNTLEEITKLRAVRDAAQLAAEKAREVAGSMFGEDTPADEMLPDEILALEKVLAATEGKAGD